jgi:quinoprotein glucose dehydrogenase
MVFADAAFSAETTHLGRIDFKTEDMVTVDDTTPEHAKACKELYDKSGAFYNAGAFTPFLYHADRTPPKSTLIFPGATGGTNWGGMAIDPKSGYVFAYTQDLAQVGWTEKKKEGVQYAFDERGSDLLYTRASVDGPGRFHTFSAPVTDASGKTIGVWPCQKPPWGLLSAVDVKTGTIAGPTATAGGLVFIGSVNDNRFRAFDSKNGRELWSFKLDATANA